MPSIRDFSSGVLNQELQNTDRGAGVFFDCRNVLSSWNGELRKRTGTGILKSLSANSKIIPYRLPNGDDMILLLSNGRIDCYSIADDGSLYTYKIGTDSTNMFPASNTWSADTNGDWTVASSYSGNYYPAIASTKSLTSEEIQTMGSTVYISNETDDFVFKSAKFTWTFSNRTSVQIRRYDTDPIIQYSDDGNTWISVDTSVSERHTTSGHVGQSVITSIWFYVYNDMYLGLHPYWRVFFRDGYITSGQPIVNPSCTVSMKECNCWTAVTKQDLVFNNCPYTEGDFDNIRWAQNGNTLTMACKGKQPYQITLSGGLFTDSLFTPSDETTIYTNNGYPACVAYYQNRLWFAGFSDRPTTVWSSAFGSFTQFTVPNPIAATSPIKVTGTEIVDPIENMFGANNALYCLSADGISMIDAQGAIVATDQVEFKLRNREPVAPVIPTVKDDIMMYIGRDKQKILITDYDFVVQRFKAVNIANNYNNFFKAGIKEIHYIPRKSSLIYGLLEDGNWFALLFDSSLQKNGLFVFDSYGSISDIQPIKKGDETKLLIISQIQDGFYYLEEKFSQAEQEIMDFMTQQEQENYTRDVINSKLAYLDHSVSFVYEEPTNIISGLPYLEGEQLEVIADGQYLGTKTVLLNTDTGDLYIELDTDVSQVVVGYAYDSYAVLKFVTPYTERKFPKEIAVNFINSGYLEVGNTFDSLKSVLNNLVESVSISNKRILMNGNYAKTLDKHSFETPYVIVHSSKGLPFIITGIDYRVDMSNYQGGV